MFQESFAVVRQPFGGFRKVVGGSPQPVGGFRQSFGGSPQPVGGSRKVVGGFRQSFWGFRKVVGELPQPVGRLQKSFWGFQNLFGEVWKVFRGVGKVLRGAVGGSIHKGFIKAFDISSLSVVNAVADLVQIKTKAISDPLGWDHNYNKHLVEMLGGDILYYDGTGRRERYEAIKQNNIIKAYKAPAGWFTELKKCADGSFTHKFSDAVVEFFHAYGSLVKIQDRNRNKMEFFYDMGGQLTAVMDTMGRLIEFEYYPFEMEPDETGEPNGRFKVTSGRLKQITDFSGRQLKFNYDSLTGDLLEADFGGRITRYTYSSGADIQLAHNLRTVTDPKEQKALTINYTETGDKVLGSFSF
ncbi:MAG: hypothetical protein NT166_09825 [Candidatus Aminicenantes bacterium]|nr:hypothetical protein [Candidatus Aminicenantes bacterium]